MSTSHMQQMSKSHLVLSLCLLVKAISRGLGEERRSGQSKDLFVVAVDLVPKAEARLRCERRDARSTRRRPYVLAIPLSGYPSSAFRIIIKYLLPSLPLEIFPFPLIRAFVCFLYERQQSLINDRMKKLSAAGGTDLSGPVRGSSLLLLFAPVMCYVVIIVSWELLLFGLPAYVVGCDGVI